MFASSWRQWRNVLSGIATTNPRRSRGRSPVRRDSRPRLEVLEERTLLAVADVAITKLGPTGPVIAGSNVTYTLNVTNNGPGAATGVALTDALPANTTFVSQSQTGGPTFTQSNPPVNTNGTVSDTITTFNAGASASFQLVINLSHTASNGSSLSNSARVGSDSSTTDPNLVNNSATATNTVLTRADLATTKTATPTTVTAGTNVTYSITVTNNGPSDAQNVQVNDQLPSNETFVTGGESQGSGVVDVGQLVTFSLGTLPSGGTATGFIVATVNSNVASGTTISNTAVANSNTADPNTANNSGNVVTPVVTSADLALTKSGPASVTAGTTMTYTLSVTSTGPSDARTVRVSDTLPAGTTFASVSQVFGPPTFSFTTPAMGGTGTVNANTAAFPAGDSAEFVIVVNVNSGDANGSTITNTATVSSTTSDPNSVNNTSSTSTTVTASANVGITKSGPATVTAGQNLSYMVTLSNAGPSDAPGTTLTDNTPAGTTFVSETQLTGSAFVLAHPGVGGTGAVTASGTLVANQSATFSIVVKANSSDASGSTITNTATVTDSIPNSPTNTATFNTTVATSADLAVTKTGPATVTAGQNLTYHETVTNNGPSDAQNVSLLDILPANATFVSSMQNTGPTFSSSNPATIGTFAAGASATFTVIVQANSNDTAGSTVTNTLIVSSSTSDPNAVNNTASTTATVVTSADVSIVKSGPATVTAGTNATYSLTVTNAGPSDAQNVTTTDMIPAGTSLVSFTQNSGPANGSTLPLGGTETYTVVVSIPASTASGTTLTDTATVSTTTNDPNLVNNTSTLRSTVTTSADLSVSKTGPATETAGDNLTYTVTVSNSGPSNAQSVTLADAIPAGATFVSASQLSGPTFTLMTPAAGSGSGSITATLGTLNTATSAVFSIVLQAKASDANGSTVVNTATFNSSSTSDPNTANNTASFTTTLSTSADLSVSKSGPTTLTAGNNVTYTITVTNSGPSDAQTVDVNDSLPAGTTFVTQSQTSGPSFTLSQSGGTVDDTIATFPAHSSAVFTITAKIDPSYARAIEVDENGHGLGTTGAGTIGTDPGPGGLAGVLIYPLPFTGTQGDVLSLGNDVGDVLRFNGDGTVIFYSDNLDGFDSMADTATPPGASYGNTASATETGSETQDASYYVPTAGQPGFDASALPAYLFVSDGTVSSVPTLTNSVAVFSGTADANFSNNSSTSTATVTASSDVSVTKSGPATVTAGLDATYTVTVSNSGPSDATGVTLTDNVPNGTSLTSETQLTGPTFTDNTPPGGPVNFSIPVLSPGAPATFQIVVTSSDDDSPGSPITNVATVSSTSSDPNLANNTSSSTALVATSADLAITKSVLGDGGPKTAGTDVTYSLSITNNGPSDALNVAVTEALPAGLTFVSETQVDGTSFTPTTPPVGSNGTVTFAAAVLDNGDFADFQIVAHISPSTADGSTVNNTATIGSTTSDPNAANNTSSASFAVIAEADLVTTKTGAPSPVTAGTNLTYTVTVSNAGPSDAQAVTVSDQLPAFTSFVSDSVSQGSASTSGSVVTLHFGTIGTGAVATGTIVVRVDPSTPDGTTISNTATAVSNTADPNANNNTGQFVDTVTTAADLSVTKAGPAAAAAGANLTYTITVANNGPSDAQNVFLDDDVPVGTAFVSESQTSGPTFAATATPTVGGTGLIEEQIDTLPAGQSAVFQIVVMANASDPPGSTITNTATVSSDTTDPNHVNNTASTTATVSALPDVTVVKSGPSAATAGTNLTYTIAVSNTGTQPATSVSVSDTVPAGATFVSEAQTTGPTFTVTSTPTPGAGGTFTGTLASLAGGGSATFQFVLHATSSDASGSTVTNTATVSASNDSNLNDNTSSVVTTIGTLADVAVTKTGPANVAAGSTVTYSITVTNNGPSDAQAVTLVDSPGSGLTLVTLNHVSGPANGSTLPAGGTETYTAVVTVNSGDVNGSTVTNTATVSSTTSDPNSTNNTSSVTSTVAAGADVAVAKTGPANVAAGSTVTYSITVTNNGPTDAQAVTLVDTPGSGLTLVSLNHVSGPANGSTLPVGGTETYNAVVMVNSGDVNGSTVTNTATVSTTSSDPNSANNTSSVNSTVTAGADLAITKSGPSTVVAGGPNVTYTLSVTNNGPLSAAAVMVSDTLPAGETFVSASTGSGSGTSYSASLGTLASGASTVITLVASVSPSAVNGSTLTDTATVSSTTSDPNLTNNTSSVNSTVATSADVRTTKTGPATGAPGSKVTYSITVTNAGPSDAQAVTVVDSPPSGMTTVSLTQTSGPTNGQTLPAGGTETYVYVGMINSGDAPGTVLNNLAFANSGSTSDPNGANNTATATTTVAGTADVAVIKTGPSNVTTGSTVTYSVKVVDNGPATATNVMLTDTVPTGMTFVSETQSTGPTFNVTTPPPGGTGTIHGSISSLSSGQSALFVFVFRVNSTDTPGSTITNTVTVSTSSSDPNLANNTSSVTSTVQSGSHGLGGGAVPRGGLSRNLFLGGTTTPPTANPLTDALFLPAPGKNNNSSQ
jgi:uncharacterized repeat protein (TIGR01451 family)